MRTNFFGISFGIGFLQNESSRMGKIAAADLIT